MRAETLPKAAIPSGFASPTRGPEVSRWLAPAAFAVALLFRLVGLGGSSMGPGEILATIRAEGSLHELVSALVDERAQPPLEPLFTWAVVHIGLGELARRALNVVLGAATAALFARWVARRFGTATGAVAALFFATSPVLVRYSHELGPYALWLLAAGWALDAADRWIERGAARFPLELVFAAASATAAHALAAALWFPVGAAWLEARLDGRVRKPFGRMHVAAAALATIPLALWFAALARWGGPRPLAPTQRWTYEEIERRLEDLLLRGAPAQPAVEHALLLAAVLAVVGFVVVARRRGGLAVLAGLVGGSLAAELALAVAGRETHFRLDQFGLVFLFAAMAAGIVAFAGTVAKWNRVSGLATAAILAGAVIATSANGLVGYAQHGRPDWPAVARAVAALEGDGSRVATTHPGARLALDYYLGRGSRRTGEPMRIAMVGEDRGKLLAELALDSRRCLLVLLAGDPRDPELLKGLRPEKPIVRLPDTDDATLHRFAPEDLDPRACVAPAGVSLVHTPGYGRLFPWRHLGEPGVPSAPPEP